MIYIVSMDTKGNVGSMVDVEIEAQSGAEAVEMAIANHPQYDDFYATLESSQLFTCDVVPTAEKVQSCSRRNVRRGYTVNGAFYNAAEYDLVAL